MFFFIAASQDYNQFDLSFQFIVYIQIFSCFVLFDACRRIYFVLKNNNFGINNKVVSLHVMVYLIYLVGLLDFYFTIVRNIDDASSKNFLIQNSIREFLSMVSMVALAYVFYVSCFFFSIKSICAVIKAFRLNKECSKL